MTRTLEYSILDVFAERALEGNALAVFHDARALSDREMQALARETNLAETTFVLAADPDRERSHGVRVRIFTAQEELPFAGHPTLGTATWLYFNHPVLRGADMITLNLNIGPIEVRFDPPAAGEAGVQATMQQNDPVFGATHSREAVARAIGLEPGDLSPEHAPQTVSTGIPFCIVPLRSRDVLRKLQIAPGEAQKWLSASDAKFFYCIAPSAADKRSAEPQWHARMQFYHGEDPATGSAAGCFISWLVGKGLAAPDQRVVIEQGVEIQRPSRIIAVASLRRGKVCSVMVVGRTIPVAQGRFFLP